MNPTEKLIEFDAREMRPNFGDTWSAERRRQFLLRQDIDKPLSTDTMIWPSVRDEPPASEQERLEALAVLEDPSPAAALEYWDWYIRQDLRVLRRFVQREAMPSPYWIIAISLVASNPLTGELDPFADGFGYLDAASPAPAKRESGWELLGYDVSDSYLLSGLSNCGYSEDEQRIAATTWATHLNRYHLFDDPAAAWRFKEFTDGRVREHQPFHVFGLWRIE